MASAPLIPRVSVNGNGTIARVIAGRLNLLSVFSILCSLLSVLETVGGSRLQKQYKFARLMKVKTSLSFRLSVWVFETSFIYELIDYITGRRWNVPYKPSVFLGSSEPVRRFCELESHTLGQRLNQVLQFWYPFFA